MPLTLKTKIVGVLGKRDYVIAQINRKRRDELQQLSKRAGVPADMLMREEMLKFISKKNVQKYVGGKKVGFVGEKEDRENLSIRCPADLAISFKSAAKRRSMTHSMALRVCVDKILAAPEAA